jgi:ornithine carbamoyltransferase
MSLRSLLRVSDLTSGDLASLIVLAREYKANPQLSPELLRGESVTLYFKKHSTRTRIAFETAIHRLGGVPIRVGADDLQIGRGETIEDTARVISRYSRVFVTRTFADEEVERFHRAASIPVINALTDGHHPCQALADLMTLEEHFGKLAGLTLAYVGAGNNVTHSLMEACALAGVHIRVATPAALEPDSAIVEHARALAKAHGTSIAVGDDPVSAVRDADAVYTDTWLSMGDPEEERQSRMRALEAYRVNEALMAHAKPSAIFLHCLPAHRGEEVDSAVADRRGSRIFDQAENKLHTSLAVLDALVQGTLEGRHGTPAGKMSA